MRNLLTEAKSLEKLINAFQKRNPNIDIEGLKQLLLSDPTIVSNDRGVFIGKYATWIGNLFAKGLIKPGDSWELKKALSVYDENKESLLPIEKYTSLAALLGDTMKLAQVAKEEVPAHKEALEKVYEDDEWVVYIHILIGPVGKLVKIPIGALLVLIQTTINHILKMVTYM